MDVSRQFKRLAGRHTQLRLMIMNHFIVFSRPTVVGSIVGIIVIVVITITSTIAAIITITTTTTTTIITCKIIDYLYRIFYLKIQSYYLGKHSYYLESTITIWEMTLLFGKRSRGPRPEGSPRDSATGSGMFLLFEKSVIIIWKCILTI